jgi:transcriptional regulator with XRE-family HTH domain
MSLVNGAQIRAARALLRMEQEQLAEAAGIAATTLRRIESFDDKLVGRHETVSRLQRALEAGGVEFTDDGRPGVRMRAPSAAE